MKELSTRRAFLAAAGVVGVTGLAGCSGEAEPATNATTTATETTSTSTTTTTDESTQTPDSGGVESSFDRGTVVDDFESFGTDDSRWGTIGGTVEADTDDVYAGTQSVHMTNENGDVAGIFKSFPDGLDLSKHDLSLAVKLEKPVRGRIAAEFLAPARSDMLTSKRFIPKELNDWVRIDLGYTGRSGDPVIESVQELRLMVLTEEGTPIDVHVDDLRKIPKPDTGKVVLQFDDSRISHYEVAFQELQERGWTGGSAIIPNSINSEGYLTTGQMREMRDAGWDMMSHPQTSQPLPQYSENRQRQLIQEAYDYLDLKGFPEGARHFVAPYNRVSKTTLDIVSEFHDAGYMFGACPNNAQRPSNMHTISRVMGKDPRGTRRVLNLADAYNQLVVVTWHTIGRGQDYETSPEDFRNVLDHIEQTGLEVVAPSDLLDG
ncbi:Peptidoglycan/xylan/chitin deacetylase, PgdA/CDA1 family [Halogranum amylolyticum]|uniref:Peptidoglycan/xylan/chitin deacetylase, PgdA/CDA1 family n=1 Tax=Halogranum amylolyticum TaxID=660520 RepID=A0A1H8UU17_9EURY|nr:polysaccharide deacetylase family protein [Halogranum amylolyticum]SEP06661.1 Peptidoglycan/xylan/chitin deacetylase, PgdA/CDA1 family [Halogranum amylolyticum]